MALALNQRGATDAPATEVPEITAVVSASEAHNAANVRRSQDQSLTEIANVVRPRNEAGSDTIINVGIAMSFGCSLSGDVPEDDVMRLVDRCFGAGVDMFGLADTVGYAAAALDAGCRPSTPLWPRWAPRPRRCPAPKCTRRWQTA